MHLSTHQQTSGPITARAFTQHTGKQEVMIELDTRASLFMSPAEAAELVAALTAVLAEIATAEMAGAR